MASGDPRPSYRIQLRGLALWEPLKKSPILGFQHQPEAYFKSPAKEP
jgi:hypothetical protein